MKKRHGGYLIGFGIVNAIELVLIWYWWVFTDEWPSFIQGRPNEGVIVPLAAACFLGLMFGAIIRDIGSD